MAVVFPHGYWIPLSTVQDREVKNLKCFIIPPFTLLNVVGDCHDLNEVADRDGRQADITLQDMHRSISLTGRTL